jgi:hypothetical protein
MFAKRPPLSLSQVQTLGGMYGSVIVVPPELPSAGLTHPWPDLRKERGGITL